MPIFDFTCRRCRHEFESLILEDNELVRGPECGCRTVYRSTVSLFSCTGVNLTKRLKMESKDRMEQGMAQMKKEKAREERIKIV